MGADRIFEETSPSEHGWKTERLGSDALDFALMQNGEEPRSDTKPDRQEMPRLHSPQEKEWVHPGRRKDPNNGVPERTLIETSPFQAEEEKSSVQFDARNLAGLVPPSRGGGMSSAHAVAGAAMRSEEESGGGEPAAAQGEGQGKLKKQKIDLDSLAQELAGRVQKKLSQMAERTGRWR